MFVVVVYWRKQVQALPREAPEVRVRSGTEDAWSQQEQAQGRSAQEAICRFAHLLRPCDTRHRVDFNELGLRQLCLIPPAF